MAKSKHFVEAMTIDHGIFALGECDRSDHRTRLSESLGGYEGGTCVFLKNTALCRAAAAFRFRQLLLTFLHTTTRYIIYDSPKKQGEEAMGRLWKQR
jgi:hypothetical protein